MTGLRGPYAGRVTWVRGAEGSPWTDGGGAGASAPLPPAASLQQRRGHRSRHRAAGSCAGWAVPPTPARQPAEQRHKPVTPSRRVPSMRATAGRPPPGPAVTSKRNQLRTEGTWPPTTAETDPLATGRILVTPQALGAGPRVIFVRCRTVANVFSMGFVTRYDKPRRRRPLDLIAAGGARGVVGVERTPVAQRRPDLVRACLDHHVPANRRHESSQRASARDGLDVRAHLPSRPCRPCGRLRRRRHVPDAAATPPHQR